MYKVLFTIVLSFSITALFAQNYEVIPEDSKVTISGTSTVHDWEANTEEFSGFANIGIEEGKLVSISSLKFTVLADGIKSGKGGMDKKIYEALDKKNHPEIIYELTEISEIKENSVVASGNLTIAGVTKTIQMEVNYGILPDGAITFSGTRDIKMTDYKISPPTAVFGTIKAGDEVQVSFEMSMDCPAQITCAEVNQ